jgi:hypothetical protein
MDWFSSTPPLLFPGVRERSSICSGSSLVKPLKPIEWGDEDNVEVDGHVKNDRYSWGEPLEAMPRLIVMSRSTKILGARPLSRCRGR